MVLLFVLQVYLTHDITAVRKTKQSRKTARYPSRLHASRLSFARKSAVKNEHVQRPTPLAAPPSVRLRSSRGFSNKKETTRSTSTTLATQLQNQQYLATKTVSQQ